MKPTIDISAVQMRRAGDRLQVLVETDGVWRLAIDHPWPADGCGLVSHVAEADGKFGWPLVEPSAPPQSPQAFNCVPCGACHGMRVENCKDYPNHLHVWCDCQ